jgi:hypothetical protein
MAHVEGSLQQDPEKKVKRQARKGGVASGFIELVGRKKVLN